MAEKISFSNNNIDEYPELVQQYNVQNTPMLVICGRDQDKTIDYGIRFLVLPSGYKFSSLIQAIGLVSKHASCLMPETRKEIKTMQIPLQLRVSVTPHLPILPASRGACSPTGDGETVDPDGDD